VSSFEACDVPLIRAIKDTGKPVIVSCGADWADAWDELQGYDASFLYCVSRYPAFYADFDLEVVSEFDGISDHSLGHVVALAAVARGAKIVEKHFILDRDNGSADAAFSMEPGEFAEMVNGIRAIEVGMIPKKSKPIDRSLCKSLFAVKDIKKGERFTDNNIGVIRPGYGLPPREYWRVLQCVARCDIKRGTPIKESML
jgi:pseudaminic acid synthase